MAGIDLRTILYAALGGIVPTFLWLWFWIGEESDHDAPGIILVLAYFGGILGVLILLPLRPIVEGLSIDPSYITVFYAGLEEVIKFVLVALICFNYKTLHDASDYTIFLVTGALGFSALENTLYLIQPLSQGLDLGSIIITGNMRFLGATVLHSISVALVGVILGLAFSYGKFMKFIYVLFGLAFATGLHTAFNYFIMQNTRQGTITAIAGIWIVAVIVILIFDRLKSLQEHISYQAVAPTNTTI